MAEEDLLFGKNRHLFGGIEPSNPVKFTVEPDYNMDTDVLRNKITIHPPSDTVIDGQTICTVGGCVIRRKTDGYPVDEFDGDLIADVTTNTVVYDENVVENGYYYYAAFPYSKQGVYNRSNKNRIKAKAVKYYIFGYRLQIDNSDPDARVTYPSDVMNANYTPAFMDYDNDTFNPGSWTIEAGKYFIPRPCVLNQYGSVVEYLDPNNYDKKTDGTDSVYNVSSDNIYKTYAAMMQWPKIYIQRKINGSYYEFRCSDRKVGDEWECWCNYNNANKEISNFYTGIYMTYYEHNAANPTLYATGNWSIYEKYPSNIRSAAKRRGNRWGVDQLCDRLLIQDLLVMLCKSTNTQEKYGYGYTSTANTSFSDGGSGMDTKGLFWGTKDGKKGVKVFGMNHLWGNCGRALDGLILANGKLKAKFTAGTKDGSTTSSYNEDGSGYIDLGISLNSTSSYANAFYYSKYGCIPIGTTSSSKSTTYYNDKTETISHSTAGSASTYHCDQLGTGDSSDKSFYPRCGGRYNSDLYAGAFAITLSSGATDAPYCVGVLSYK